MTNSTHYRLTCEEWLTVSKTLKLAELRVLYYLRTLDPFGDRCLDLKVVDIAEATGLTKGTVSKALRSLDVHGLIDLELVTVKVRLKSFKAFPGDDEVSCRKPESSVGNSEALQETSESCRKPSEPIQNEDQSEAKSFPQFTNNNVQTLNKQNRPTTHPVFHRQRGFGTASQTITGIEASGIRMNQNIQRVIQQTIEQFGESAAIHRIENALAAVQEQVNRGHVPNPGGMLVTAIRKGFTPNQASNREPAFSSRPTSNLQPSKSPPAPPPIPASIDLSNVLVGIQLHCERLGWSKQDAIAHMVNRHGWKPVGWSCINDPDLYTLLDELQHLEV